MPSCGGTPGSALITMRVHQCRSKAADADRATGPTMPFDRLPATVTTHHHTPITPSTRVGSGVASTSQTRELYQGKECAVS